MTVSLAASHHSGLTAAALTSRSPADSPSYALRRALAERLATRRLARLPAPPSRAELVVSATRGPVSEGPVVAALLPGMLAAEAAAVPPGLAVR
jgi:hypothetical protein